MKKFKCSNKNLINPYIYQFGYHLTPKKNINSILQKGFLVKQPSKQRYEYISKMLYNNKEPIYFLTSRNLKNIAEGLSIWLLEKSSVLIETNIKNFEQIPDIYALMEIPFIELNFLKNSDDIIITSIPYFWKTDDDENFDIKKRMTEDFADQYPLIFKWFQKYKGTIPIPEFKNNKELSIDTIITTQTFCITQNISPKNIIKFYEV